MLHLPRAHPQSSAHPPPCSHWPSCRAPSAHPPSCAQAGRSSCLVASEIAEAGARVDENTVGELVTSYLFKLKAAKVKWVHAVVWCIAPEEKVEVDSS